MTQLALGGPAVWWDTVCELGRLPGLRPRPRQAQLDLLSVFARGVRRDPAVFAGPPTDRVCAAVNAELGVRGHRADRSLHRSPFYCPGTKLPYRRLTDRFGQPTGTRFPDAEQHHESVRLSHRTLLAARPALEDVVVASDKVAAHARSR